MKPFALLSTAFLGLVALAHLARVLLQVDVRVGAWAVPSWASVAAFLFTGALALLLAREQRRG